jgi:hypothetical protein
MMLDSAVAPYQPHRPLRDWHFVPKDLYAIDLKNAKGRELSAEEIDQRRRFLERSILKFGGGRI